LKKINNTMEFNFKSFLIENGWYYFDDTIFKKGTYQINLKKGFFLLFNNNKEVKHNHIATCKTPTCEVDSNIIFKHLNLK